MAKNLVQAQIPKVDLASSNPALTPRVFKQREKRCGYCGGPLDGEGVCITKNCEGF